MSFCGKPEGLSALNIMVAGVVVFTKKVRGALKGTEEVVIQSPCAVAMVVVITWPVVLSITCIGKEASKNQLPRASPVMVKGLVIISCGDGALTYRVLRVGVGVTTTGTVAGRKLRQTK